MGGKPKYNPIDVDAFSYLSQNSKKFLAVVSNLEIGLPDYIQPSLLIGWKY
jgi:hypothetical protein